MKRVLVSAAAVLALAACAKKDQAGKAADAGSAATPASASASAPASASLTPPTRKVGLWEQTMSTGKMTQTSRICFSDEVNKQMTFWGQKGGETQCSERSITPTLGGWKFASTCNLGAAGTIKSQGEAKGDFGTHYTVNIKSSTTGAAAPQMNGEHEMTLEATWKGPCPPDFKPGDMEVNGMKINMLAMTAGGAGAGGKASAEQVAAMRKMVQAQMEARIKAQHDGR